MAQDKTDWQESDTRLNTTMLANTTAEPFVQTPPNTPSAQATNCFFCHNPSSFSFQIPPPAKLTNR